MLILVPFCAMSVSNVYAIETPHQPESIFELPPDHGAWRCFLANYNQSGGTDIYEIVLDSENHQANLNFIKTLPQKVSLAWSSPQELLYLVRETAPTYQTLDVSVPDGPLGFSLIVATGISGFTGAAMGLDGRLYGASEAENKIYHYTFDTEYGAIYSPGQIAGGDIAFGPTGKLYMVSQSPSRAYEILEGEPNISLGPVPEGSTGLALMEDDNFLLSAMGDSLLYVGDEFANDMGIRYTLKLNGETFTHTDGDLASGFSAQSPAGIFQDESIAFLSYPNPSRGISNVVFKSDRNEFAQLDVLDMQGRFVAGVARLLAEANQQYTFTFDGSNLPNGIYVYRLTTENSVEVKKFMIAR
jgi:hypothetical protein